MGTILGLGVGSRCHANCSYLCRVQQTLFINLPLSSHACIRLLSLKRALPSLVPSHSPPSLRSAPQDVVDGDLCERFVTLTAAKQKTIAADLQRSPLEVIKKLEDVRGRL